MIASGLDLIASFIPWLQKHRKACFFTMGYGYAAPERGLMAWQPSILPGITCRFIPRTTDRRSVPAIC